MDAEEAAENKRWRRDAELLAARGDVDGLLAAALIQHTQLNRPLPALILLDRANALDPRRADVAWIDLQLCQEVSFCDTRPRAERVRKLDPQNAAGWYSELRHARENGDPHTEDAALASMAATSHFNIHYNQVVWRAAEALQATDPRTGKPLWTRAEASSAAIGWVAYLGIPTFTPVSQTCKDDRLQRPETAQRCKALVSVLEAGDTYIAEAIGFAIGRRVWPDDSPERQALENRGQSSQYYRKISAEILPELSSEEQALEWLELLRSHSREQDAFQTMLRLHGRAVVAPPD